MNRLQEKYQKKILPALKKDLKMSNDLAVPKLEKIIINMGIGDTTKDKTNRDKILKYIAQIAGQKPQLRKAKKAIAEFEVREGDPVGVRVTLRGVRMYEFMDKLVSVVLARLRDFRGVPT